MNILFWRKLSKHNRRYLQLLVGGILVVLIPLVIASLSRPDSASASWFDDSWGYRQAISVTISSSSADISNLETLLTIDTTGITSKVQASCQDLRFTSQSGKVLPYYIDSCSNNSATNKVWVMADLVPKNTTTYTIYMYYGNPSAKAASDATKFTLFKGLVGYWTANESSWSGAAGEVKDNSVNGNNGVRAGDATTTASGKYSYAGTFDGTGDYFTGGSNTGISGNAAFTLATWVKLSSTSNGDTAVFIGNSSSALAAGAIYFNANGAGSVSGEFAGANGARTAAGVITTGQWYHVVIVKTPGAINTTTTIYVNGVSQTIATAATGTPNITNAAPIVGRFGSSTLDDFNGQIDDVRVYNRALTLSEVEGLYQNPGTIATTANATVKPTTSFATEEKSPAPIAYWSFDEGYGQAINDSSSSRNNGTLGTSSSADAADPTWQTEDMCVSGKCLYFDGSSSYIDMEDPSNGLLDFGTGSFTISLWFKGSGTNQIAFNKKVGGNTAGYDFVVGIGTTAGNVAFRIGDSTNPTINGTTWTGTNDSKWHHVVGVIDRSAQLLYTYGDGKLIGSVDISSIGSVSNTTNLNIGAREGATNFNGFMDEVKIYPYARSSAQILTDFNGRSSLIGSSAQIGSSDQLKLLANGLVGWWKQDEATWSGTLNEVKDSSGNGNHGTSACIGTGCTKPFTIAGKFGKAGEFDGSQDYVSLGSPSSLQVSTGTIAMWMKSSNLNNFKFVYYSRNDDKGFSSASTYSSNTWYHVVLSRNSSGTYALYINGSAVSTNATSYNPYDDSAADPLIGAASNGSNIIHSSLYITTTTLSARSTPSTLLNTTGGSPNIISIGLLDTANVNRFFQGVIDDVRVYNRVLPASEITQLYNADFSPGPVGYWDFEDGSGATVTDKGATASASMNNGTWNGTGAHWTQGKYGKGGKFNGTDDYTAVGDPSSGIFDFGTTTDFSLSAWVKIPSADDGDYILAKYSEGTTAGYAIQIQSSHLRAFIRDGTGSGTDEIVLLEGSTNIVDNNWHFVSAAFDRDGNISIYVDGKSDATPTSIATVTDTINNNISLDIGRRAAVTLDKSYITGQIDEVKIYNYARSAKQIVSDMNAGHPSVGSPVGSALLHLTFDDGFGNVASNSGNIGAAGNAGLYNMSSPATTASGWNQSGKFGKALQFDSVNDYALISNSSFLDQLESASVFTISFWAKKSSYALSNAAISIHNNDSDGSSSLVIYPYDTNNGNGARVWYNGASIINQDNGNIANDTWHYFTFVSESSTSQKLYVDSQFLTSSSTSKTLNSTLAGFHIGSWKGTTQYYGGTIDEIKMYNYALTADEVKLDMNRGSALVLGSMSDTSGLAGGTVASNSASAEYCVPGDTTTCTAPVARWDFEEGNGINVNDRSGNNNNGTWNGTGTTHWTGGKVGKAGNFNGSDDYTSSGNVLDIGTGSLTVEAWVKTNAAANQGIVTKRDTQSATNKGYLLMMDSTGVAKIQFSDGSASRVQVTGTISINDNKWHHVVAVFNRTGNETIYVDGVSDGSGDISGQQASSTNNMTFKVGAMYDSGVDGGIWNYWNGQIDDVKIYNYARSAAQVAWDYNRGGPVGHWKFDECQGDTIYDWTDNANNGTITIGASGEDTLGTCTTSSTAWGSGATGKRNYSLDFDGTDDYVDGGSGTSLNITSAITVAAWIKSDSLSGTQMILGKDDGTNRNYGLQITNSNANFFSFRSNSVTNRNIAGSTTLQTGVWYHIVGTYESNGKTNIYLNGVKDATELSDSGSIDSDTVNFYIGNRKTDRYFSGQIDDVQIFNYALTTTQIKILYNNGAINFSPLTGAP